MFNINQYGDVVNIDSEDVTFHITGSYISGTTYMMANIWAEGYDWNVTYSGTFVANVELIKIRGTFIRNGYYYDHNDDITREITPVSGTSQLIFSTYYGYYADGFVANGDYIYFGYYNETGSFRAVEYSISEDTSTDLEVDTYGNIGDVYQPAYSLTFVKDRKILVSTNVDYPDVYTINFEDSSIEQNGMTSPLSVKSTVINDEVWACVLEKNSVPEGFKINYRNFDGVSGSSTINFTFPPSYDISEMVLVQNKYLCWAVASYNWGSPFEEMSKVFCFDVNELIFQESDWIGDTDFYNNVNHISSVCGGADGNFYFTTWAYFQTSFPPYESCDMWYQYNPSTNLLTLVHSQGVTSITAPPQPRSRVISSVNTTYIWDYDTEYFIKQYGSGDDGVAFLRNKIDFDFGYGNYSCASDNNGQRFAYVLPYTIADNLLHIQSMDGKGNQDVSVSGIIAVHHIGNYFVAVSYSGSYLHISLIS